VSFEFVCDASCDVAHRLTLAFLEGHEALKWEGIMSGGTWQRFLRHMEWSI